MLPGIVPTAVFSPVTGVPRTDELPSDIRLTDETLSDDTLIAVYVLLDAPDALSA